MPRANLPHTLAGWLVAMLASFVGFVSGFVVIALLSRMLNGS